MKIAEILRVAMKLLISFRSSEKVVLSDGRLRGVLLSISSRESAQTSLLL